MKLKADIDEGLTVFIRYGNIVIFVYFIEVYFVKQLV